MRIFGFNVWVLAGLVLLAVVLGAVNNLRLDAEMRVPWFGTYGEVDNG